MPSRETIDLSAQDEDYYYDTIDDLDESGEVEPSDPAEARKRRAAIAHGYERERYVGHPIKLHNDDWGVVVPPSEDGDEIVEGERLSVQNVCLNGKSWPVTTRAIFVEDGYAFCTVEKQTRSARSKRSGRSR